MQQSLLSSNSGSEHEDKQRADEMTINMFYFELQYYTYFYHFELQLQNSSHAPWLGCIIFMVYYSV